MEKTGARTPTNVVAFYNEHSSNSGRIGRASEQLESGCARLGLAYNIFPTTEEPRDNLNIVREFCGEDSTTVVLGGDGALNGIASIISEAKSKTNLTTIPTGGAADTAHMLGNHRILRNYIPRFTKNPVAEHSPLVIEVSQPDGSISTHLAIAYASIAGMVAQTADQFNQPDFRASIKNNSHPLVLKKQALIAYQQISKIKPFRLISELGDLTSYDLTFANGHRMASGAVHFNTPLLQPKFGMLVTASKPKSEILTRFNVLKSIAKAAIGLYPQFELGDTIDFKIETRDEAPFPIQFDGETIWYPNGSSFKVYLSPQKLKLITNNLQAQKVQENSKTNIHSNN